MILLFLTANALALPALNKDGERIDIKSNLVAEKTNVIFFHAPWSKTSSRYKVELERWQESNPDTVVHLVNVKSLTSPVAKQCKLTAVPAFAIFDGEGKLLQQGQSAQNEVVKMLAD